MNKKNAPIRCKKIGTSGHNTHGAVVQEISLEIYIVPHRAEKSKPFIGSDFCTHFFRTVTDCNGL